MDKIEGEEAGKIINIGKEVNGRKTTTGKKGTATTGEYIPLATFEQDEEHQQQQQQRPASSSDNRSFVIDIPTGAGKQKKSNNSLLGDNQPLMSYRGESGPGGGRGKSSQQPNYNNNESADSQVSVDMKYSKGSPSGPGGILIGGPSSEPKVGVWARWFGKRIPQARSFPLNETSQPGFPPNKIRNQKYHAWSFLFVVLFNQVNESFYARLSNPFDSLNISSIWCSW